MSEVNDLPRKDVVVGFREPEAQNLITEILRTLNNKERRRFRLPFGDGDESGAYIKWLVEGSYKLWFRGNPNPIQFEGDKIVLNFAIEVRVERVSGRIQLNEIFPHGEVPVEVAGVRIYVPIPDLGAPNFDLPDIYIRVARLNLTVRIDRVRTDINAKKNDFLVAYARLPGPAPQVRIDALNPIQLWQDLSSHLKSKVSDQIKGKIKELDKFFDEVFKFLIDEILGYIDDKTTLYRDLVSYYSAYLANYVFDTIVELLNFKPPSKWIKLDDMIDRRIELAGAEPDRPPLYQRVDKLDIQMNESGCNPGEILVTFQLEN